jgi:hypothetical protein
MSITVFVLDVCKSGTVAPAPHHENFGGGLFQKGHNGIYLTSVYALVIYANSLAESLSRISK